MKRLFQIAWHSLFLEQIWRRLSSVTVMFLAYGMIQLAYASHSDIAGNWPLDEGMGQETEDSSGHGNDGQLGSTPLADANDPAWIIGLSGFPALHFGGNDFVEVAESATLEPAAITAEAWVKNLGSPGPYRYALSKGAKLCTVASYAIYTGASGGLFFYISNGSTLTLSPDAGTGIWDGDWHHVAGTFDGSVVRLYVDGVEIGSGTPSALSINYLLETSKKFFMGTYQGTCALPFNGDIDKVRVWKRALSPSEIALRAEMKELTFASELDHFKCYEAGGNGADVTVDLEDQFGVESKVEVEKPELFCNPVAKTRDGEATEMIGDPTAHLTGYKIEGRRVADRLVIVRNQFGDGEQTLKVKKSKFLFVPTQKLSVDGEPTGHAEPAGLDHFKCYEAEGDDVDVTVDLEDQFGFKAQVLVDEPKIFCNPVKKTYDEVVTEIGDPEAHLTCYGIKDNERQEREVLVRNQFREQTLQVEEPELLCVPSEKLSFEPVEGDDEGE